jgi:phosphonate transport system substrate-binding protein
MSSRSEGRLRLKRAVLLLGLCAAVFSADAGAKDACKHRGDLDTLFCDEDGDLLADTPKDAKRQKDPDPLFSPIRRWKTRRCSRN